MKKYIIILMLLMNFLEINAENINDSLKVDSIIAKLTEQFEYTRVPEDFWYLSSDNDIQVNMINNSLYTMGLSYKFRLLNMIDAIIFEDTTILHKKNVYFNNDTLPYYDIVINNSLFYQININSRRPNFIGDLSDINYKSINLKSRIFKLYFYYWCYIFKELGINYCIRNKISCIPPICQWK